MPDLVTRLTLLLLYSILLNGIDEGDPGITSTTLAPKTDELVFVEGLRWPHLTWSKIFVCVAPSNRPNSTVTSYILFTWPYEYE